MIEQLDPDLRKALEDRFEGWELVDFLSIPIEDVIDMFEEEILASLEDVKEFAGLREQETDE